VPRRQSQHLSLAYLVNDVVGTDFHGVSAQVTIRLATGQRGLDVLPTGRWPGGTGILVAYRIQTRLSRSRARIEEHPRTRHPHPPLPAPAARRPCQVSTCCHSTPATSHVAGSMAPAPSTSYARTYMSTRCVPVRCNRSTLVSGTIIRDTPKIPKLGC
jgi:hypothetical protein